MERASRLPMPAPVPPLTSHLSPLSSMFRKFIERPVLATVVSILLVILGVLGLTNLPLERFPDIAPPAVLVTAVYPGANAETILRSVAPSLEESINGVE